MTTSPRPRTPGADLPEHPDFLWRDVEPKKTYDVVVIGGGGHGLATSLSALRLLTDRVTAVVTATDEELVGAMRVVAGTLKQVVEPTGVLGLAAVLSGAVPDVAGLRVGVVLSGGNVDLERFAQLVGRH